MSARYEDRIADKCFVFLAAFFLSAGLCSSAFAESKAQMKVQIRKGSQPVAGIRVEFENTGTGNKGSRVTDKAGNCSDFFGLSGVVYKITPASNEFAFEPGSRSVTLGRSAMTIVFEAKPRFATTTVVKPAGSQVTSVDAARPAASLSVVLKVGTKPLGGIQVDFEETVTGNRGSRVTDRAGNSGIFRGTAGATYEITPTSDNYNFDPPSKTVTPGALPVTVTFQARSRTRISPAPGTVVPAPGILATMDDDVLTRRDSECSERDSESLLATSLARETPQDEGSLAEFGYRTVIVGGNGATQTLSEIAGDAFREQDRFRAELARIGNRNAVLYGDDSFYDRAYEQSHSYILHKETRIVVAAPRALAASSKFFRDYLQRAADGPKGEPMKEEYKAKFYGCLKQVVPEYPDDHPIRKAFAAGGESAVLQALLEGKGDFAVAETLVVPKRTIDRLPFGRHTVDLPLRGDPVSESTPEGPVDPGRLPRVIELRSWLSGKTVAVEDSNGNVQATADRVDGPEAFFFVPVDPDVPNVFAMRSVQNGRYVHVSEDGRLRAISGAIDAHEMFAVTLPGGDRMQLLSLRNGKYVGEKEGGLAAVFPAENRSTFLWKGAGWEPAVQGRVLLGGSGLADVPIRLRDSETGDVWGTRTNDAGQYSVQVPVGRRPVLAPDKPGYRYLPEERALFVDGNLDAVDFQAQEIVEITENEPIPFSTQFLAGFTKGASWDWERRWSYPTGFFRITLGAGYGVGLRIPMKLAGELDRPFTIMAPEDKARSFVTEVHVDGPLSADAGFYRKAGLPDRQVFEGKEFILEAHAKAGLKFRVFWTDIFHISKEFGFDESADHELPLGGEGCFWLWEIPTSATQSEFHAPAVSGGAQAGLEFCGVGQISLEHIGLFDAQELGSTELRLPRNDRSPAKTITILPVQQQPGKWSFGFNLDNPRYSFDFTLKPKLRLTASVGVGDFSRSFRSDWFTVMTMPLGRVYFPAHEGTPDSFRFDRATKEFRAPDPE